MLTIQVTNYFLPSVKDNRDPLARQTRVQVKDKVTKANGRLVGFEVTKGTIFITVDTPEAAKAVKDLFATVVQSVVEEIEPLQAIYMKSQLRPMPAEEKA